MTLAEISQEYRVSADKIRSRLLQLRKAKKESTDPAEQWQLDYQIARLTAVLTQLNELTELTEHYYDRGYYRDKKYTF